MATWAASIPTESIAFEPSAGLLPWYTTGIADAAIISQPQGVLGAGTFASPAFSIATNNFAADEMLGVTAEAGNWVYGKFYTTPSASDVGAVGADYQVTYTIWSAHFHNNSLSSVAIGQAGVTLNNPATPIAFLPTETKTYIATISKIGAPTIDCDLTFTFSTGEIDVCNIVGFRAVIWPFCPQIPFSETIKPSTWIFESDNGKEQRGKLRDVPRRTFSFSALLNESEWRFAQHLLRNRHGSQWILPSFEQAEFVSATYTSGDNVVTVDTTAGEYYAGGLIVIWQDYQTYFVSEIESLNSTTVTLTSDINLTLTGNLRIMPASVCRLSTTASSESDRVGNRKIKASFDAFSGPDLSGLADAVTLGGYGVLTIATESGSIPDNFKTEIWDVDGGDGAVEWVSPHLRSLRSLAQKTTLITRAEIYAFKRWVHSHHGAVPFWLPTRFKDLYLSANLSATATSFRVVDDGFFDLSYGAVAVALYYPDGSVDYREVVSFAEYSSTETTVNIAATTNAGILTPPEVRISLLLLCRLDGDVKIEHSGYDADAKYSVKEVLQ
jgi:hypothetical protein